jgi:hypothetical protein
MSARFTLPRLLLAVLLCCTPLVAQPGGGALDCDGANDFATIPDAGADFDFATTMTLEAWVRTDTGNMYAVGGFSGAFVLGTSDLAVFTVSTPGTDSASSANSVTPGVWTHVAGTYDGATIRIYVNGALAGTEPHSGDVSDATELRLCRHPNAEFFSNGAIDEVRVWDVVRTGAEINDHYRMALTGHETGLVGYYRFDEGGGQLVLDSSDRGNDGFLGATSGPADDDPSRVDSGAPLLAPGPCVRDERTACLYDRFEVRVEMRNFANPPVTFPGFIQTYQGVSSETEQSVSFYSFNEGNVEVFVKMVDACSTPSLAFWLFAAGATNAATDITVRDSLSEEIYTIQNPSGLLFQTVADTQAFKTCGF